MKRCAFVLLAVLTSLCINAQLQVKELKIETMRLPDLNIPRAGHQVFFAGDGPMVAGGHTNGFVPTPTAEYLKDGKWHVIPMTYNHDFGLSVVLKSGKVLLAGGCEQPTGIGHTYTAELYDPKTHTFRGFGNMSLKRVWASALELDSGRVVIAGNWYNTDGIELFNENQSHQGDNKDKQSFAYIKKLATDRAMPYIFRTTDGNALILGSNGSRGDTLHCTFAERLNGDTVHIPLFETWQPIMTTIHHDEASLISDDLTYLLPVHDSTGQVAIARICGTDIHLLPTACDVPIEYQGERIEYFSNIIVDRKALRAYLIGISSSYHVAHENVQIYVLSIDYAQATEGNGAPLTLYHADSLDVTPDCAPLLTPEGNLLIAGGMTSNSNYNPSAAVYLLRLGSEPEPAISGFGCWSWVMLAIIVLAAACLWAIWRKRRKPAPETTDDTTANDSELMNRISELMESKKLYLNSELKLSDVATSLGTNRFAISNCINSQTGGSFTQLVNKYRINHARRLLRTRSDIKISEVWMTSGFSTERTFLRTFKQLTGMTPSEFKTKID